MGGAGTALARGTGDGAPTGGQSLPQRGRQRVCDGPQTVGAVRGQGIRSSRSARRRVRLPRRRRAGRDYRPRIGSPRRKDVRRLKPEELRELLAIVEEFDAKSSRKKPRG